MSNETNKIIRVSAAIITDQKKRFLLQKKDSGYPLGPNKWSLFGGRIERDEDSKKALIREIKEEIGISFDVDEVKFLNENFFEGDLNKHHIKVMHDVFSIKFKDDISKISLGEGAGFGFYETDELEKLDLMDPTRKILEGFIK